MGIVEFSSKDGELLNETFKLRAYVWNSQTGLEAFKKGKCSDNHDEHSYHWGIIANNCLVGSARLCIHDNIRDFPDYDYIHHLFVELPIPIAMLNRLVVHPAYQGQGIGKDLTQLRIQRAKYLSCKSVMMEAPSYRMK